MFRTYIADIFHLFVFTFVSSFLRVSFIAIGFFNFGIERNGYTMVYVFA